MHSEFNTEEIKNITLSEFKDCYNFKSQYLSNTGWLISQYYITVKNDNLIVLLI